MRRPWPFLKTITALAIADLLLCIVAAEIWFLNWDRIF